MSQRNGVRLLKEAGLFMVGIWGAVFVSTHRHSNAPPVTPEVRRTVNLDGAARGTYGGPIVFDGCTANYWQAVQRPPHRCSASPTVNS